MCKYICTGVCRFICTYVYAGMYVYKCLCGVCTYMCRFMFTYLCACVTHMCGDPKLSVVFH